VGFVQLIFEVGSNLRDVDVSGMVGVPYFGPKLGYLLDLLILFLDQHLMKVKIKSVQAFNYYRHFFLSLF
jgi:hypothetical protein